MIAAAIVQNQHGVCVERKYERAASSCTMCGVCVMADPLTDKLTNFDWDKNLCPASLSMEATLGVPLLSFFFLESMWVELKTNVHSKF